MSYETLSILIDMNPIEWKELETKNRTIKLFLIQLFEYLKHNILSDQIKPPSIIAYNQTEARFIFPEKQSAKELRDEILQFTSKEELENFFHCIIKDLINFNKDCRNIEKFDSQPRLDLALMKSICFLSSKKFQETWRQTYKRILVFSLSNDSNRVSSTMSAIFTAKRENIVIDTLVIGNKSSLFLNQAADLTHGFYKKIEQEYYSHLLQYLLCIPPLNIRDEFFLTTNDHVSYDFPVANCNGDEYSDKRQHVSVGYMCPCCLQIFSQYQEDECPICHVKVGKRITAEHIPIRSELVKRL